MAGTQPAAAANQPQEDEDKVSVEGEASGNFTSPDILMFPVAIFFDVVGLVLNIFFDLNIISDTIALAFIGIWALNKSGDLSEILKKNKGKKGGALEDIIKRVFKQFGGTLALKLIPEIGVIISFFINSWTYRVYKVLKS